MWDISIVGVDLYHIVAWLYIYSVLGWLWESSYISVKQKKLVNRGFVVGPLCTIYGVGAVGIYLLLKPLAGNWILLYFGGVFAATILEYVTAVIMEQLFHTSWWDYSGNKFNFQGRICLSSSVAWGFFTLIMFEVLQPFAVWIVSLVSIDMGHLILMIVTILYGIDFTFATMEAIHLGKRLEQMEKSVAELAKYLKETKIYISTAEFIEKLEPYRQGLTKENMKERTEDYIISLEKRIEKLGVQVSKEVIKEKLAEMGDKLHLTAGLKSWRSERLLRAYPWLGQAGRLKRRSLKEIKSKMKAKDRIKVKDKTQDKINH